ncbi:MAG: hypothetical protein HQ567_35445, partial [Candidatus Nealsonbacteria bacterium]|nr:hypothetical protein [Candidatus Nealsonbacteria bacterium]
MSTTQPPDGRMAKWILLLTLFLVLAAKLAAGAQGDEKPTTAELYATAKAASVEVLVDGHLGPFSAPLDALQVRPGWWGLIMGRE